jgi:hydrogenase nickel incorporation protein HypB
MLSVLHPIRRVAAVVGDLATDRDGECLRRTGAPACQITTGTLCHLDAQMVETAVVDWDLAALDVLFVENVGNPYARRATTSGSTRERF